MIKRIGSMVGILGLLLTLMASWGHFYAEQRINTREISTLKEDKQELSRVVYTLNTNQAKLVEAVSNQTSMSKDTRADITMLLKTVNSNQVTIAKILGRIEREDR